MALQGEPGLAAGRVRGVELVHATRVRAGIGKQVELAGAKHGTCSDHRDGVVRGLEGEGEVGEGGDGQGVEQDEGLKEGEEEQEEEVGVVGEGAVAVHVGGGEDV